MTPEVRTRIEQIRHGNVPEGYKRTKAGLIPASWRCEPVDTCLQIRNNERKPISDEVRKTVPGPYPYYGPTQAQGYISTYESEGPAVLIGEDGDHFLKYKTKPMTLWIDGKYTVNNHAHMLSGTEKCESRWFYYAYQFKSLLSVITRQGAGRYKLTKEALEKLPVQLPPIAEQKKIAEILTTQDKVIDLKEKLLAEKQRQKKYLMQQLLTGKKRLPGFEGEWETAKSVFDFKKGEQINGIELNDTFCYPMYNGGVTYSGYTRNTNCENAIIISEGGNSCGFVNYVDGKFWAGGHCYYVTHSKLPYSYLYQLLKLKEPYIMSMRVGSGLPNIQKSALECLELTYPVDLAEQKAIAHILIAADREIDLLHQDIEQEKQKKKALMQLLLTGIVRV
ncbi:MAG: restriction endonuclease subunit S [bacterium]|nr:restriction endonuclease subunit S [bacterium]